MTSEELQEQINTLTQQQLTLAATVNQPGTFSSNRETPLEVAPNFQSYGNLTSLLEDFTTRSRNYKNYAKTRGRWIFGFLMSQAALVSLKAATARGQPAVAGIAESIISQYILGGKELTEVDRQFIGSVVRYRMETNGYRKAEKTGSIPYRPFTQGQVYQQILN